MIDNTISHASYFSVLQASIRVCTTGHWIHWVSTRADHWTHHTCNISEARYVALFVCVVIIGCFIAAVIVTEV